jgi:tetratricopeptide (TPR) repeat protein
MSESKISTLLKSVLFIIFTLLFLRLSITPVDSLDFGFHIRTGEDIVKNLKFPLVESYSYTAAGNFNPAYSWVFDVLNYFFYALLGIHGLMILQIILALIILSLVFILVFRIKPSPDLFWSFLLIVNILLAFTFFYAPRIMVRPQLLGNVFLILFLLIAPKIFSKEYSGLSVKGLFKSPTIWLAVILLLIWVNTHSSFAELFVILLIGLGAQVGKKILRLEGQDLPLRNSIILFMLLFCFCFLNPNFYRVFATFTASTKYTEEFFSLFQVFPKSGGLYIAIVLAYLLIFLAFAIRFFIKKDCLKGFLLTAFMALGVYSVRFLGDLGVAAAVLLLPEVTFITDSMSKKPFLKKAALFGMILVLMGQLFLIYFYRRPFGWGLAENTFPVNAVNYLNGLSIEGEMFNSYEWGGYLIWNMKKHRVYIDGRIQIYPDKFIENYQNQLLKKPPFYFMSETEKWKISFALVPYPSQIGNFIANNYSDYLFDKNNWALVYFDNESLVYMKRGFSANNDALIKNLEYALLEPTILVPPLLEKYLTNETSQKVVLEELERAIAVFPNSIYAHFCLGYCQFQLGNVEEAIKELEMTKKLYPHPQVLAILDNLKSLNR